MASNDYHFHTHWRVQSTPEEMTEILSDAAGLMRWWPAVYLKVEKVTNGGEDGVGTVVRLYTKGWLPYTLRWNLRITKTHRPTGFSFDAFGDFEGAGTWRFEQEGEWTHVRYDWNVRAQKPLLRRYSRLLRPIFSWNHDWAMRVGEESLKLELRRRHAKTAAEQAAVPPPPPPTFTWLLGRA